MKASLKIVSTIVLAEKRDAITNSKPDAYKHPALTKGDCCKPSSTLGHDLSERGKILFYHLLQATILVLFRKQGGQCRKMIRCDITWLS
jgi:hypothetical protein